MKSPLPSSLLLAACLLIPGVFPESREGIMGGKEVKHRRPYMARIEGPQMCAGALIQESWVLTAAHCSVKSSTRVILGAKSISQKEKGVQTFSVKKAVPYPCFDPHSYDGDLQLLQLEGKATMNEAVGTLQLPKRGEDVKPRTPCHVAGWGSTTRNSPKPSKTLREVNITVIDRRTCNDEGHYDYSPVINRNMICAGGVNGEGDTCKGDSGSPLICAGIFRGVTSFGECGNPRKPGVYILLTSKYLNWIKKTVAGAV